MYHGMGIKLDKLCTIIILQFPDIKLFVIDNLKVLNTDYVCDGKSTKIPKRDFIFARVKTGQVGT